MITSNSFQINTLMSQWKKKFMIGICPTSWMSIQAASTTSRTPHKHYEYWAIPSIIKALPKQWVRLSDCTLSQDCTTCIPLRRQYSTDCSWYPARFTEESMCKLDFKITVHSCELRQFDLNMKCHLKMFVMIPYMWV